MPARLVDLCFLSVRGHIENGIIRDLSNLEAKLRQRLLQIICMHGSINNSNCITALSIPEFLQDISTVDLQDGFVDDHEFLDHAANSLATTSPSGNTMHAGISQLKLKLYGFLKIIPSENQQESKASAASEGDAEDKAPDGEASLAFTNLKSIIRLIAACSNLKSLDIRFADLQDWPDDRYYDTLLKSDPDAQVFSPEVLEPCLGVLSNLQELALTGRMIFFNIHSPIIESTQLTTLRLHECRIKADVWTIMEHTIRQNIETLEIMNVMIPETTDEVNQEKLLVLQAPFPQLKKLHYGISLENGKLVYENLGACPNLEQIEMNVISEEISNEELIILNSLKAKIKIGFGGIWHFNETLNELNPVYDNFLKFRVVDILGDKVTQLNLSAFEWDRQFVNALEHTIKVCQNLEILSLEPDSVNISDPCYPKAMSILHSLFENKERTKKLEYVTLAGDLDHAILTEIIENCTQLDSLRLRRCPQLTDAHLIKYANKGGRPSIFVIQDCMNVTEQGVIPLVINCAEKLRIFVFEPDTKAGNSKMWGALWRVLAMYCRHVELVYGLSFCKEILGPNFFHGQLLWDELLDNGYIRYV